MARTNVDIKLTHGVSVNIQAINTGEEIGENWSDIRMTDHHGKAVGTPFVKAKALTELRDALTEALVYMGVEAEPEQAEVEPEFPYEVGHKLRVVAGGDVGHAFEPGDIVTVARDHFGTHSVKYGCEKAQTIYVRNDNGLPQQLQPCQLEELPAVEPGQRVKFTVTSDGLRTYINESRHGTFGSDKVGEVFYGTVIESAPAFENHTRIDVGRDRKGEVLTQSVLTENLTPVAHQLYS